MFGDIGGVAAGSSGLLVPRGSPASSDPRARQAFAAAASGEDGGGAQTPSRRLRAKTLPGSAERLGSVVHAGEVVAGEGDAADMSASARRRLRSKTCPGSGEEEWFCELRGSEGLGTVASQDLKTAGADSAAGPAPAIASVGAANDGGASGTCHAAGGGRGSRAGRGPSGRAAGGVRGGRGRRAPDEQAEVPRREEAGVRRSARIRAQGTGEQLPKSQPSAAGATIRGGILSRPARGSSDVVSATQPSASGTAVSPARTRQRIVCGFGNERVPDLAQFQRARRGTVAARGTASSGGSARSDGGQGRE